MTIKEHLIVDMLIRIDDDRGMGDQKHNKGADALLRVVSFGFKHLNFL